jgi:hypothetical protein
VTDNSRGLLLMVSIVRSSTMKASFVDQLVSSLMKGFGRLGLRLSVTSLLG